MKPKINAKMIQQIKRYNTSQLLNFISSIYKSGYQDGCEASKKLIDEKTADMWQIKIAIQATEGVGELLTERIMENIKNLCFKKGSDEK